MSELCQCKGALLFQVAEEIRDRVNSTPHAGRTPQSLHRALRLNFVTEYCSARHSKIGLFMKTNTAVIRLLYENSRRLLTVAEGFSFKP